MANKIIVSLYREYLYHRNKFLCKVSPKLAANIVYKKVFGRDINWEDPQDLIEKIAWLELNTDTSLWTLCSDKYRVREYLKQKGCENIAVKLLGVWKNPDEIDFDKLPQQFVLKANNGWATVMIVKDKSKLNVEETKKKMKNWLKRPYGYASAQLHYLNIDRCIIAEELLHQSEELNQISPDSMVDFKIWCINGKPESILVTYNRGKGGLKREMYSTEWESISHNLKNPNKLDKPFPKPSSLKEMLEYATILSQDFPEVRVDFYEVDNKPRLGELTFTSGYGSFTEEYYRYLGSKLDLSTIKTKK